MSILSKLSHETLRYWQVDAFTHQRFKGNPAAVILMDQPPFETDLCQKIAAHLNLSQTAFVDLHDVNNMSIRWFSPKDEAPICGHATLASAHILLSEQKKYTLTNNRSVTFSSLAGPLHVEKRSTEQNSHHRYRMTFPKKDLFSPSEEEKEALQKALGIDPQKIVTILKDDLIYVVHVDTEACVSEFIPNFTQLVKLPGRAVCLTSQSQNGYDFVSRYFAPKVGIYEDPVCGSAHCRLTPYWANVLNKKTLVAHQLSKRGGILYVGLDDHSHTVSLEGEATTVLDAQLRLPSVISFKKAA